MAKLLWVRTGKISLIPRILPKGKVQLGYVEVASSDFARDALVGLAPLLSGMAAILLISIYKFEIPVLDKSGFELLISLPKLGYVLKTQDAWFWIYLVFTISSTLMPSESDRHAWLPVILFSGALFVSALLLGAGVWLEQTLSEPLTQIVQAATIAFSISIFLHCLFYLPVYLIKFALVRITGYSVK